MESRGTENTWKKAFEGADAAPSDAVWNNIESDLVASENARMKRSVVFYQRLAAACVLFALLAGGYAFYTGNGLDKTRQTAVKKQVATPMHDTATDVRRGVVSDSVKTSIATQGFANVLSGKPDNAEVSPRTDDNSIASTVTSEQNKTLSGTPADDKTSQRAVTRLPKEQQPSFSTVDNREQTANTKDPIVDDAAKVSSGAQEVDKTLYETKSPNQRFMDHQRMLLTNQQINKSINQSLPPLPRYRNGFIGTLPTIAPADSTWNNQQTNSFASNFQSVPLVKSDSAVEKKIAESPILIKKQDAAIPVWAKQEPKKDVAEKESLWASAGGSAGIYNTGAKSNSTGDAKGPAYTFGVAVAGKVFPRWVVQGGVNYINQSATNSTALNAAVVGPTGSLNTDFNSYNDALKASNAGSYSANSLFEFVSVPVQVGYLLVDHKFGFVVNAGAAPNIFVRNSLVDNSGHNETFSTGAGDASPYKTLSWSGLVNTELSWKLARQYRFALVPGMRYSLNPIAKTGNDRPYAVDLGFRVRYSFF